MNTFSEKKEKERKKTPPKKLARSCHIPIQHNDHLLQFPFLHIQETLPSGYIEYWSVCNLDLVLAKK